MRSTRPIDPPHEPHAHASVNEGIAISVGASGTKSGRRPAVLCMSLVATAVGSVLLTVLLTMLGDGRLIVNIQVGDTMYTSHNATRSPSQPKLVETNTSQIHDAVSEQRQSSLLPQDPAPIYVTTSSSRPAKTPNDLRKRPMNVGTWKSTSRKPDPPWLMRGVLQETPSDIHTKRIDRGAPALRRIRHGAGFTWKSNRNLVESAGHVWCNFLRDNWACHGKQYAQVLKQTPVFNRSFALSQLPSGTNILVHGHSHLALLVTTLICASRAAADVEVYKISAQNEILSGNSLVAYLPKNNVTVLLLSNERIWDKVENYEKLFKFLSLWRFSPLFVLLGQVNSDKGSESRIQRLSKIRRQFPKADILPMSSSTFITDQCQTPQCTTGVSKGSHSCSPGPILRHAERLGKVLRQQADQHTMAGKIINSTFSRQNWAVN
jgi:hypothetical protein